MIARRLASSSLLAVTALLTVAAAGCDSCAKKSATSTSVVDAAPPAQESEVAAPESLVAEATLTTPDAFWKKAQAGMGTTAAILPSTFAGLACALAGLDPSVAREVDPNTPAYASIADLGAGFGFALAMRLTDPKHTQSMLVDGAGAPFTSRDLGSMRVLASKNAPLQMGVAIARAGWLLMATNDADLASLGPYTYRTLPTRARPASAIEVRAPRPALAGPLRARLATEWSDAKAWLLKQDADNRKKHDGREPDFGDAPSLVACVDAFVQRRLAMVGDLEDARLALDAGDDEVHAILTMKPGAPAGVAAQQLGSMHPGDGAPLLEAPLDAAAAWLFRDAAPERAEDTREIADCARRALGKRLGEDDAKKLADAAEQWSKGRGDLLSAAVMWGSSRGLVAHAPAANGDAASHALRDVVDLLQRPVLKAPLARYFHVSGIAVGGADVAGVGKVTAVTLTRDDPRTPKEKEKEKTKSPAPAPLGMAWATGASDVRFAIGDGAPQLLGAAFKPKATYADDASIARAVRAFEGNVTFAVVAKPFRFEGDQRGGAPAPPFTFAWGRRAHDGWARVEIGYALLRELLRRTVGF